MSKLCLAAAVILNIAISAAHASENCAPVAAVDGFHTQGWGFTKSNERYQAHTGIDKSNVDRLAVKWAFALDGGMSPHSYPVVSRDTVFIGTQSGMLHALDRETGCVRWSYDAGNAIRTGVIHGRLPAEAGGETYLFFGTQNGRTHAVVAATGERGWVTNVGDHSMVQLTGTPAYHDGRLYVPVSSTELVMAIMPWYGCCTFRGQVVALDAANGKEIWRTYMVPDDPKVTGTHYWFVQKRGPSGAPIWSAPTIDPDRGLIYVGTGQNYSSPATGTSDAILAINMETGAIEWVQQYLAGDAFNVGCAADWHPNCPEEDGPDLDFGAPPVLTRSRGGQDILLAGQKSGGVYGLDPDTGARIWERQFGRGGLLGGVHWGMAVNPRAGLLFAPINDMQLFYQIREGVSKPALHALDIATGKLRWSVPMEGTCGDRAPCDSGLSAALAATPDLVFAGALDGYIRAHDAETGEIIWRFDTWGDYESTDGRPASGGTIDVHGPMIAGDMMFIQSGYGSQALKGGNAFLAFKVMEADE